MCERVRIVQVLTIGLFLGWILWRSGSLLLTFFLHALFNLEGMSETALALKTLSVSTHAANHHEVRSVQLCFDFYMIEAKPETLIGDRAYDSDPLDDELHKDGIEMVAPHRSNRRKCATQDGRRLRRYARRWLVERFFAWIQWQRRILVRWEFYPKNFLGFVQLACLVILFKRF